MEVDGTIRESVEAEKALGKNPEHLGIPGTDSERGVPSETQTVPERRRKANRGRHFGS